MTIEINCSVHFVPTLTLTVTLTFNAAALVQLLVQTQCLSLIGFRCKFDVSLATHFQQVISQRCEVNVDNSTS